MIVEGQYFLFYDSCLPNRSYKLNFLTFLEMACVCDVGYAGKRNHHSTWVLNARKQPSGGIYILPRVMAVILLKGAEMVHAYSAAWYLVSVIDCWRACSDGVIVEASCLGFRMLLLALDTSNTTLTGLLTWTTQCKDDLSDYFLNFL